MEYYNDEIADNDDVELVWASADQSEDAMEDWAKNEKFPWPTVKFKSARKIDPINDVRPRGVPGYVLLDAEGEVLAKSTGTNQPVKQKIKELAAASEDGDSDEKEDDA